MSIWKNKEEEEEYYQRWVCPICKEKTSGIGWIYKEIRICDNCYCDITGMQKITRSLLC